jgi:hypothetical protein
VFRRLFFELESRGHLRILIRDVHFERENSVAEGGILFRDNCGVPVMEKYICAKTKEV